VVVGGGCYGTFYASQLAKAKARGKTEYRKVLIIDRNRDCRARRELGEADNRAFVTQDWSTFFDDWLSHAPRTTHPAPDDQIVPSPHMPHLMFEWVLRRARQRWPTRAVSVETVPGKIPTPYDRSSGGPDATRYVSWADWICPTHCIEPALCPAIGASRTWEMGDTVREPRCSCASIKSSAWGCSPRKRCAPATVWSRRPGLLVSPQRSWWGRSRAVMGH